MPYSRTTTSPNDTVDVDDENDEADAADADDDVVAQQS
jgi:hypothetical protein